MGYGKRIQRQQSRSRMGAGYNRSEVGRAKRELPRVARVEVLRGRASKRRVPAGERETAPRAQRGGLVDRLENQMSSRTGLDTLPGEQGVVVRSRKQPGESSARSGVRWLAPPHGGNRDRGIQHIGRHQVSRRALVGRSVRRGFLWALFSRSGLQRRAPQRTLLLDCKPVGSRREDDGSRPIGGLRCPRPPRVSNGHHRPLLSPAVF